MGEEKDEEEDEREVSVRHGEDDESYCQDASTAYQCSDASDTGGRHEHSLSPSVPSQSLSSPWHDYEHNNNIYDESADMIDNSNSNSDMVTHLHRALVPHRTGLGGTCNL